MPKELIEVEPLLKLREVIDFIEELTGHRPSRTTLWRWNLEGRLKTTRVGKRIYANKKSVEKMLLSMELQLQEDRKKFMNKLQGVKNDK